MGSLTRKVNIGDVIIGGGEPIAIQSMTNVNPHDERGLLEQICRLKDAGCNIIRLAVPDREAARVFGSVKKKLIKASKSIPMVADIHFDYRLAIEAMEEGADKIRINPGNIGTIDRVEAVVKMAKERSIPIRIGVNSGSLEKDIVKANGGVTAEGIVESALKNVKLIENLGYDNLVISIKSSDVKMNYDAHKILAKATNYPLHIGITESGTLKRGGLKSAIGIGALLLEGIGDTMRVSLTSDPIEEIHMAKDILGAVGMNKAGVDLVSCPTCGRTKINLESLAIEVEKRLPNLEQKLRNLDREPIKIAVMGCAVNGPGEAKEADFGIAGGVGEGLIFRKGQIIKKVSEEALVDELFRIIEEEV